MSSIHTVSGGQLGRPQEQEREVVRLSEWSRSDETYDLSDADRHLLNSQVNFHADEGEEVSRIGVEYDRHGQATFRSRQFVGTVALPDGPTIQIVPKAAGNNLLYLLRYARGVSPTTIEQRTEFETGDSFIDALAALYADELAKVLNLGLQKEYREIQRTESRVRGQIQVHRQLQDQGPVATTFECRFNELTTNTIANQSILYAAAVLNRLTADKDIQQNLNWHIQRLRRATDLRHVAPAEFEKIQLTRLNEHYTDILRLAEPVIRNLHIENLDIGLRGSYSLLVNMNTVFERAVERAIQEAIENRPDLNVTPQARTTNLLQGTPTVSMYPDFIVTSKSTGETTLVGDAKWKTGSVANSDLYQITAYSLAHDASGVLLYPAQSGRSSTGYSIEEGKTISVIELPTSEDVDSFEEFVSAFEQYAPQLLD